ncbi:MAG: RnfABCDGE type electron transport complex subunit D [SAR324 cluster bacterium]|nr:RnfABCDGE type electron transport complex subunit D [SAR324 cluster bacterium]
MDENKENLPQEPAPKTVATEAVAKEAAPEEPKPVPPKKKKKDPRDKLYKPNQPLVLTASPHDYNVTTTPQIMWSVLASLVPALGAGIFYFGLYAGLVVLTCILFAILTEYLINLLRKVPTTITDGSALLTGLLLGLTLPPTFSLVSAALGSIFAIAVGKQIFGGLGYNIFNPALIGRAFLQASFPVPITTWVFPNTAKYVNVDATTAATPLGLFKFEGITTPWMDLITGNIGGSIGETSAVAILLGGLYLVFKKYADWRVVVGFLGSTLITGAFLWLLVPDMAPNPFFHIVAGGALFGAFFMATDMVTSPVNPIGAWIFGLGCGFLLVIIRVFGGLPEGVMYSILLMNGVTPLINRYTRPKYLGEIRS